jgi:hypothetical protein
MRYVATGESIPPDIRDTSLARIPTPAAGKTSLRELSRYRANSPDARYADGLLMILLTDAGSPVIMVSSQL